LRVIKPLLRKEQQRSTKKSRRQGISSVGFQRLVSPAPHLTR
jgi:hypothetical protein